MVLALTANEAKVVSYSPHPPSTAFDASSGGRPDFSNTRHSLPVDTSALV